MSTDRPELATNLICGTYRMLSASSNENFVAIKMPNQKRNRNIVCKIPQLLPCRPRLAALPEEESGAPAWPTGRGMSGRTRHWRGRDWRRDDCKSDRLPTRLIRRDLQGRGNKGLTTAPGSRRRWVCCATTGAAARRRGEGSPRRAHVRASHGAPGAGGRAGEAHRQGDDGSRGHRCCRGRQCRAAWD
jgi:hypothetical protein